MEQEENGNFFKTRLLLVFSMLGFWVYILFSHWWETHKIMSILTISIVAIVVVSIMVFLENLSQGE
jgi:hypothetical protein